jgi:hypothetical protein
MNRLFNKIKFLLMTLLFTVVTAAGSIGPVYADAVSATSPLDYTGQGYPIKQQCSEGSDTPAGTMLFIFSYGGNYSPTNVTLHGITVLSQSEMGNETHIFTAYSDNLTALEQNVNVTWDGSVGNAQLVISHGCAPATTPTPVETQAPVVKADECGTDNDTYTVPGVTGVVYKVGGTVVSGTVSTNGALSVTIHAYPASSDYTLTGTTEWTLTFTNEDCNQTVTPTGVTFIDLCGVRNDVYVIPATTGVDYQVGGVTQTDGNHNGSGSVTVTAVAQTGYSLTGTTSWSHTFTDVPCVQTVTPAPVSATDVCGVDNDTYFIPTVAGVTYEDAQNHVLPAGTNHYTGGNTFTVHAVANQGYALTGTTSWNLVFTNEACPCGCNDHTVTADQPTFHDVCGLTRDSYTIPSTEHVSYYVNGSQAASPAGKYYVHTIGTVTIKAVADQGYTLTGDSTWSHDFTNKPCKVTPKPPMFNDVCGTDNDTFTIPHAKHVVYMMNQQVINPGTYDGSGTVTITAQALPGYKLKHDAVKSWTFNFTDEDCGGHGGQVTPVTPAAVTFKDICATANDTYTIPTTVGVEYWVNGAVKPAGTYSATGTVNITAMAASAAYSLEGTTSWSHTFTNESCGQVLGETTTVFTPTVQAGKGGEVLANTGSGTIVSSIIAFLVIVTSLALYAYNPKYES